MKSILKNAEHFSHFHFWFRSILNNIEYFCQFSILIQKYSQQYWTFLSIFNSDSKVFSTRLIISINFQFWFRSILNNTEHFYQFSILLQKYSQQDWSFLSIFNSDLEVFSTILNISVNFLLWFRSILNNTEHICQFYTLIQKYSQQYWKSLSIFNSDSEVFSTILNISVNF